MVSQPHGQGPREPRQSQRPRPKRSRSHSKTKALELGSGRSFRMQNSSRNLGHKNSEFILKLSTIKPNLPLYLSTCFSLDKSMLSPHIFQHKLQERNHTGLPNNHHLHLDNICPTMPCQRPLLHLSKAFLNKIGRPVLGESVQMTGFPKEICNTVV